MLKVNSKTRKRCEICSKLTIKTPKQSHHFITFSAIAFQFLTLNRSLVARNDSSNCYVVLLISFDQCHIINWRKLKKLIGKCFPKQYVEHEKPQNLKKMLRKSPASNV